MEIIFTMVKTPGNSLKVLSRLYWKSLILSIMCTIQRLCTQDVASLQGIECRHCIYQDGVAHSTWIFILTKIGHEPICYGGGSYPDKVVMPPVLLMASKLELVKYMINLNSLRQGTQRWGRWWHTAWFYLNTVLQIFIATFHCSSKSWRETSVL